MGKRTGALPTVCEYGQALARTAANEKQAPSVSSPGGRCRAFGALDGSRSLGEPENAPDGAGRRVGALYGQIPPPPATCPSMLGILRLPWSGRIYRSSGEFNPKVAVTAGSRRAG